MLKVLSLAAAIVIGVPAWNGAASEVTIQGELVEIACAASRGAEGKGQAHAACALTCAKRGEPVGVLTSDAVYEVAGDFTANDNARLLDFLAKQVSVTGELTERDGKKLLNVRTIRLK
jgi:molybdopterin-guanine dinucleotide biosynthesis protein A